MLGNVCNNGNFRNGHTVKTHQRSKFWTIISSYGSKLALQIEET